MNLTEMQKYKKELELELAKLDAKLGKHTKKFCAYCSNTGEDFMSYKCPYTEEPWHV